MASSFKDLSLDWLIQNNDDVMILVFDQQREYYANLLLENIKATWEVTPL